MALFPSVIPWTLVLTQVMTAGLAVVPGRWAHLFRKCLQVQVLCGWARAGDPRGLSNHFLLGLALLREKNKTKRKKKLRVHSSKSCGGKWERSQDQGPRYSFFVCALSHAHINIQCQTLLGALSGAGHFDPGEDVIQPTRHVTTPTALSELPPALRRRVTQPDDTARSNTPLIKWQYLEYYELSVSSPQTGPSVAGDMVFVRGASWAAAAHPDALRAQHSGSAPANNRFMKNSYVYRYTKHVDLIQLNFSVVDDRGTWGQSKTGYIDSLIVRTSNTIIVLFYPF